MGRLFDGPTKSLRALTPPARVALVCSYSHHLTQDTIPWNLGDLKPAWDPHSRSLKLLWTGKSRVHFTEPCRLTCPFSILFTEWCWSCTGCCEAGLFSCRFQTPTSSISEVLGQWTRWRDYGCLFFCLPHFFPFFLTPISHLYHTSSLIILLKG